MALDEDEDLRDREQPHDRDQEVHPVHQVDFAEREARNAGLVVEADHRDAEPEGRREGGLRLIARREPAEGAEGEQVEGEVLRRAEEVRDAREDRGEQHEGDDREQGADEGGHPGQDEGVAGPSLFRHGIAVQGGHEGRLVPGNVQQERRDPSPVPGPAIARGHEHQCRGRIEAEGEGERNQDGDPVRGAEPGECADDGAEEAAADGENHRGEGEGDREPVREIGVELHLPGRSVNR